MAGALNFLQGIFRGYFHMCLAASLVILVVLILRLILKSIPKNLMCVLWLAVLFRLLCPVTVAGPLPRLWLSGQPESGTEARPGQNATADRTPMADMAEGMPAGAGEGLQGLDGSHGINDLNAGSYSSDGYGNGSYGSDGYGSGGYNSDSYGSDGYGNDGFDSNGYNNDGSGSDGYGSGGYNSDGYGSNGYGSDDYGNAGHDTDRDSAGTAAVLDWFAALTAKEWAIFLGGIAALAGSIFFLIRNALRFHKTAIEIRMAEAVRPCTSQRIWGRTMAVLECERKNSPMVFGLIRPRICLPSGFAEQVSAREYDLILKHEGAHIRRGDCLLKYLSWIALSIHWWNPLARISVKLLQKDIEMACDEYVLAHSGEDVRKEYATVLLRYSMAQSGMTFPVAFGESSTEKRVGNILKYRKMPVICTLAILGIMGALTVCLVTNPHNRKNDDARLLGDGNAGDENAGNENTGNENTGNENTGNENTGNENAGSENAGNENAGNNAGDPGADGETEGREDETWDGAIIAEDGRLVFSSKEQVRSYYQGCWQEKLTADSGSSDAERIIVRQAPWIFWPREKDAGQELQVDLGYYVMDYFTGIPTSYHTYLTYEEREGKIYVNDSEDESFEHVTTAEQAKRMGWHNFGGFNEFFGDVLEEGTNYAGFIVERAMLSSGIWQFDLERPETSIPLLMHLEGGSGEFQRDAGSAGRSGYLTYTFEDGSTICYNVSNRVAVSNNRYCSFMDAYFPTFFYSDPISAKATVETARQAEAYLQGATVQDFRNVDHSKWNGNWDLLVTPVLLDMIQDRDVALYGLGYADAVVLRDGDQFYPVYLEWLDPAGDLPEIYMGDYDGDGEDEYAIVTHLSGGTGLSVDGLYILEKNPPEGYPKELSVYEFDRYMQTEQLNRVSYDWDPEQQAMHMRVDGELTGLSVPLGEWRGEKLTFQDLVFGEIISFTEVNGQLYFRADGGVMVKEVALFMYERGVTFTAPIIYSEGTFSLGEITLTESGR